MEINLARYTCAQVNNFDTGEQHYIAAVRLDTENYVRQVVSWHPRLAIGNIKTDPYGFYDGWSRLVH